MDIVTARRSSDGSEIKSEDVNPLFRPLYAKMRYNPYSDDPKERWKFVFDKFAPAILGGLGAWGGSTLFAYGKGFNGKPFHPPSTAVKTQFEAGKMSAQTADATARRIHGDSTRIVASTGYPIGAAGGVHPFGAIEPLSASMSAISFQLFNLKKINFFGLEWVNKNIFSNRGAGSSSLRPAMAEATRWAETQLVKLGDPKVWLKEPDQANQLQKVVRNALQDFRRVTPEMEKGVTEKITALLEETHANLEKLRQKGTPEKKLFEAAYGHLSGEKPLKEVGNPANHGFIGQAFDRMVVAAGVPLHHMDIGSHDMFSFLARSLNGGKKELELEDKWRHYLKKEYNLDYGKSRLRPRTEHIAAAYGAVGAAGVGLSYAGINYANKLSRRNRRLDDPAEQKAAEAEYKQHKHWIDGKPLDGMQWAARVLITPPSMHRLLSAGFLSATLFAGMKFADILTGRSLKIVPAQANAASLIAKESVPALLRPLHGILHYTPGSRLTKDRLNAAAHYIVPVFFGGAGTYLGSKTYFHDRTKKLEKPETLEEYADRISMEQSKPFAGLTAITSVFNTGSGLHMVPFVNYSSNLNNRFLMGSGQQVAAPAFGKWWSGNPGMMPWGVKGTLDYLSKYLANNEAERPRDVSYISHSLLAKLYPTMDDETLVAKKQLFINRIHEVRDSYMVGGVVPKENKEALQEAMNKLLHGEGFEDLLELSGFNPAKADLASNGVSGKMANALGARKHVLQLEREYEGKLVARQKQPEHLSAADYLHSLAEKSESHVAEVDAGIVRASNDSGQQNFADRVKNATGITPKFSLN